MTTKNSGQLSRGTDRPIGRSVSLSALFTKVGLTPFRMFDGEIPLNFEDHLAEEHAQAIIAYLEPNLIGDWRVRLTEQWGRFKVCNDNWSDKYIIGVTVRDEKMRVSIGINNGEGIFPPVSRYDEVPLEIPNLIELLCQFVFDELGECENQILINKPILRATPERKELRPACTKDTNEASQNGLNDSQTTGQSQTE